MGHMPVCAAAAPPPENQEGKIFILPTLVPEKVINADLSFEFSFIWFATRLSDVQSSV